VPGIPSAVLKRAKYEVRNLELVEDGPHKAEVRNHREEIVVNFFMD
jgi:hypothetical protein